VRGISDLMDATNIAPSDVMTRRKTSFGLDIST